MNTIFSESILPPTGKLKVHFSKPAIALILATVLLGLLLAFSTYQNINREKKLMASFLEKKAETIVRSVEAGARTSMRHHMGQGDPLSTLVEENSREDDIVFIQILDKYGKSIAQTGEVTNSFYNADDLEHLADESIVITHLNEPASIYHYARKFRSLHAFPGMQMRMRMMSKMQMHPRLGSWNDLIIAVGLSTHEFELARQQDSRHTLMMAAILFLVGTAGLYFVFLYQSIRIAKLTLTDMKLYTQNVIESMPAGLLTLDRSDIIVSCNKKAADIMGASLADIQGKNIWHFWPENSFDIEAICSEAKEETVTHKFDNAPPMQLQISGSSLHDHQGVNIGRVLVVRDTTVLHILEKQLERSRRMASLGKMAAGIAHEIRNPLGTLRGFAQYFGAQPEQNEEGKSYADLMVSEVDRLNHTVSSLLQFARPREPEFRAVEIDQLFNKTHRLLQPDLKQKDIQFTCAPQTGIRLAGDEDLLLQVLLNLIKNSIGAVGTCGQISLLSEQLDNSVNITVSDNGKGMSQEEKDRMFDPFFTTKKTGTGLGLAVSHQIIEQHNGSIEVETTPGKGCKIILRLPQNSTG